LTHKKVVEKPWFFNSLKICKNKFTIFIERNSVKRLKIPAKYKNFYLLKNHSFSTGRTMEKGGVARLY